jgi:hypothetical protein
LDIGQLINGTILVMMILMFMGLSRDDRRRVKTTTSPSCWLMTEPDEGVRYGQHLHRDHAGGDPDQDVLIIFASASRLPLTSFLLLVGSNPGQDPALTRHFFVEYSF